MGCRWTKNIGSMLSDHKDFNNKFQLMENNPIEILLLKYGQAYKQATLIICLTLTILLPLQNV